MARERIIKRKIAVTEASILCVSPESPEGGVVVMRIPGLYKSNKSLLKAAKAQAREGLEPLHVVESSVTHDCYTIKEADFIEYATLEESE